MGRKVLYLHPRQNEIACIVCNQVKVLLPNLGSPSDEPVPSCQMPHRGGPSHACDWSLMGEEHVLQVLSDRMAVPQVMVLGEQAVVHLLETRPPDLAYLQRLQITNACSDR